MDQRGANGRGMRVVVVGAGIIGASIALHLARRDVAVTVVESQQPGAGASGHSFAYINAFAKLPVAYHDLNRRSMDMWDRFARLLEADVGLRWGGMLRWESTDQGAEELRRQVGQVQPWGYPSRLVDEAEMRRLEPGLSLGTVTAAVLNESEGHVDPQKVAVACLQRASGATVHLDTPATELSLAGGGGGPSTVRAVQTRDGEIACDVVVLAAGLETTQLAATAGLDIPQQESPGVVIRTGPRPPVLKTVSVVYTPRLDEDRPEIHLRQAADGSLMIGAGTQESLSRDDSQENADRLLARAMQYFPALAGAKAIPVPVGYRPLPLDGLPIIGFTEAVPNLYIALMHSGVTLAPLVGEMAALEIVDGARVEMLDRYRLERSAPKGRSRRRR